MRTRSCARPEVRFADPQTGAVLLDGHDVREVELLVFAGWADRIVELRDGALVTPPLPLVGSSG